MFVLVAKVYLHKLTYSLIYGLFKVSLGKSDEIILSVK